jgi:hypothetical protein
MYLLRCPVCGFVLELIEDGTGHQVQCPNCHRIFPAEMEESLNSNEYRIGRTRRRIAPFADRLWLTGVVSAVLSGMILFSEGQLLVTTVVMGPGIWADHVPRVLSFGVWFVTGLFLVLSSQFMRQVRHHGLCLVAAGLCVVNPLVCFTIFGGVRTFRMLMNEEIRATFALNSRTTEPD